MPLYQEPPYTPPFTPQVLTPGRPLALFVASDVLVAPANSAQFCMHRGELPMALSVEVQFSADPGVFEIDFETADVDDDSHYTTKDNLTGGLNASFVGRMEITDVVAKFARLTLVSVTNPVSITATIY